MHDQAYTFVARQASRLDGVAFHKPATVVELGSRETWGPRIRDLFPDVDYVGVDAQPGAGVDVVANAATWQPTDSVDLVLCCEVFEHTPRWPEIVANAHAMLAEHGVAIFTCAGTGRPVHGVNEDDPDDPGWYQNVRPFDLRATMRDVGFQWIEASSAPSYAGTDTYAIGWRS